MNKFHIYKITNLLNGKIYIGQTTQFKPSERWNRHCSDARLNKEGILYSAMRKYGISNFKFEILLCCSNLDDLNYAEELLISTYNCLDKTIGYNIESGGNNKEFKQESKEKLSKTLKEQFKNGRKSWNDGLKYNSGKSPWNKGKSGEYKINHSENVSKALKGIPKSEEHKRNLSVSKKEQYKNNNHVQSKTVICKNDNLIFRSASEAALYYQIPITSAARVANGGRKSYKGLFFQYTNLEPNVGVIR